ncbi:MAG: MATE family efflux transporter [Planctomycetota bacterium]
MSDAQAIANQGVAPERTFRTELRHQVRLAFPIVVGQLGMMLMNVVDTAMVGRFGREGEGALAMSAVTQASLLFMIGFTFAMGVLLALDPVLSHAAGADDRRGFARGVQRGFVLVPVLSLVASAPLLFADVLLRLLDQPEEVRSTAVLYADITVPGVVLGLAFVVLRQALVVIERTGTIVATVAIANVANAALDYALIHGHFGLPAMGAGGSALASTLCRALMFGVLLVVAWKDLRPLVLPLDRAALALAPLVRMARLGVAIGSQNILELGAFAFVAIAMGWFGTVEQAGHAVAMNLAAVSFMVPLGIGSAASVRVGKAVGRGDGGAARLAARCALVLGVGFMCASGVTYLLVPDLLTALYTDKPDIARVAATLIPIAGAFQLFDGTQVVGLGVLRGAGDTFVPALVNFVGYWIVGIPLGLHLALRTEVGYTGLWWGLVAGLAVVATFLVLRIVKRLHHVRPRVDLDRAT